LTLDWGRLAILQPSISRQRKNAEITEGLLLVQLPSSFPGLSLANRAFTQLFLKLGPLFILRHPGFDDLFDQRGG
jgi:hypothetical protein